jgi:hypothetical protein
VNGWLLALVGPVLVGLLARTVARAHRRMRARTATLQQLDSSPARTGSAYIDALLSSIRPLL